MTYTSPAATTMPTTTNTSHQADTMKQTADNGRRASSLSLQQAVLTTAVTSSTLDYDDASSSYSSSSVSSSGPPPVSSPLIQGNTTAAADSIVLAASSPTSSISQHRHGGHSHHHSSSSPSRDTSAGPPSPAEVVAACAAAAAEESPNGHKVCAKDVLAYFRRYDLENFLTMMLIELGIHTPSDPREFMCDYIRDNLVERHHHRHHHHRHQFYDNNDSDDDEENEDDYIYFPDAKNSRRRASRRRSIQTGEVMHRYDDEDESAPPAAPTLARSVSHRWSRDLTSSAIRSIVLRRVSRQLQKEDPSVHNFVQQWMREGMGGARDSTSTGRGSVSGSSRRASDSVAYDEARLAARLFEVPTVDTLDLPDLLSWETKLFNIDHSEIVRRTYGIFDKWNFVVPSLSLMHPVPPANAAASSSSAAPHAPDQQGGAPSAPRAAAPQPKAAPQQPPLNTAFALQFLSAWTEFSSGLFVRDREKFEEYCSDVLEAAYKAGAKVPEEAYSASRVEHPQAQVDRSGEALRLAQLRQLQQQRLVNAQQQQQQHAKRQEPRTERAANGASTIAQKICGCADTSKATAGTLDCDQLHRFMALTVLTKRGLSIPLLNLGQRLLGVWLLADFFRKRDQVAAYLRSLVEAQPEAEKTDEKPKSEAAADNGAAADGTETKEEEADEDTEMKDAAAGDGKEEVKKEPAERSTVDNVQEAPSNGPELDGATQAAMKDVLSYLKSQGMKWSKDLAERFSSYLTTEGNPFCPRFLSRDKAGPMGSLLNAAAPEPSSYDERFIFIPDAKIFCQTFCYAATWAPLTDLERNLSCLVFGDATGSPSAVVAHPAFVRSPTDKQQQAAGRPPQALVAICNDTSGKFSQAAVLQWISMSTPSWMKYAKECREAMSWIPREHTGFLLTRVLQPPPQQTAAATTQAIPQASTPAARQSLAQLQQMSPAAAMAIFQQQAGMALRSESQSNQVEVPLRHQPPREASRRSRGMYDESSESEFDSDDESSSESAESEGGESMNTHSSSSSSESDSSDSSESSSDSSDSSDSESSDSEAEQESAPGQVASPSKKRARQSSPMSAMEVVQPGEEAEKSMYVAATGEGDQKEFVWRVTDDVKVKAKLWKGMVFMDIRKYYDEGRKPTQKGVFLNVEKYEKVVLRQEMVTAALKWLDEGGRAKSTVLTGVLRNDSTFIDPDGAVIIEVDKGLKMKVYSFKGMYLVDIRSYFKGNATKKGISLKPDVYFKVAEWKDWTKAVAVVKKVNGLPMK
ncbi:MmpL domain protein [Perkinsus chesapeaki]|uniref:MmpL domain protein n=1 Tax=Perkinsus chesapeaki TaxID=330153 RepID=A0A7J6LM13_PERCH|nr:MmpL domain protein [Perkinsus chesapeaki]